MKDLDLQIQGLDINEVKAIAENEDKLMAPHEVKQRPSKGSPVRDSPKARNPKESEYKIDSPNQIVYKEDEPQEKESFVHQAKHSFQKVSTPHFFCLKRLMI